MAHRCDGLVSLRARDTGRMLTGDRLLGFMGGPTDGTYSVQPRHMNVRHPRNLNDNDIEAFDDSTNSPVNHSTQMSYFLQRIRIAEIIRAVLDAIHPGSADGDITDYDRVLALDRLFEQAFLDLPPFFQGQQPLPARGLDTLELQRVIIQLGLLSRRARLHRPFLLQQCRHEPRHQRSREICLQSTRAVVALATNIIQSSLDFTRGGTAPSARRHWGATERKLDTPRKRPVGAPPRPRHQPPLDSVHRARHPRRLVVVILQRRQHDEPRDRART